MKLSSLFIKLTIIGLVVIAELGQCQEEIGTFEAFEKFSRGKVFYNRKHVVGDNGNVAIKWFNQTLDHFVNSDTRTWLQVDK